MPSFAPCVSLFVLRAQWNHIRPQLEVSSTTVKIRFQSPSSHHHFWSEFGLISFFDFLTIDHLTLLFLRFLKPLWRGVSIDHGGRPERARVEGPDPRHERPDPEADAQGEPTACAEPAARSATAVESSRVATRWSLFVRALFMGAKCGTTSHFLKKEFTF